MDSASFYQRGSSITQSHVTPDGIDDSSFATPTGHSRSYIPARPSPRPQHLFRQPDVMAVNQKLDHVLAIMMEQKQSGK